MLGSAAAALAVPVAARLAGVSVALALSVLPFTGALLTDDGVQAGAALFARPSGRLLVLGVAAFAALVCEGPPPTGVRCTSGPTSAAHPAWPARGSSRSA
ncbi:MAG: hypothetical protein H0T66_13330 [Geodermatophilaceae bacterium]|nr:hypothetical protein [Geodermatophilaceae bacterium]MDQ3456601.1 hypothetical protein [Actinomycetota bacterium]